jgi:hypothetical protein
MKKLTLGASAVALTLVLSVAINAQSIRYPLKANIPFDFHVGDKVLHEGTYTVTSLNATGVLALRYGKDAVAVMTTGSYKPSTERDDVLVFNHVNNDYFLTAIYTEGTNGYKLPTTKKERESMAQGTNSELTVLLASVR